MVITSTMRHLGFPSWLENGLRLQGKDTGLGFVFPSGVDPGRSAHPWGESCLAWNSHCANSESTVGSTWVYQLAQMWGGGRVDVYKLSADRHQKTESDFITKGQSGKLSVALTHLIFEWSTLGRYWGPSNLHLVGRHSATLSRVAGKSQKIQKPTQRSQESFVEGPGGTCSIPGERWNLGSQSSTWERLSLGYHSLCEGSHNFCWL